MISIVIPHFNDCERMFTLLCSIPECPELQIVIVDDASEDISSLIGYIKDYRQNVKIIINKMNLGAGACRNIGLSNCNNEWVLFADSDDYFTDSAFRTLYEDINKEGADSDVFVYLPLSSHEKNGQKNRARYYAELFEKPEFVNSILFYFDVPWSKLIRRKVILENGIKFGETSVANDVLFSTWLAVLIPSRKVHVSGNSIYTVVGRTGSLTNSLTKDKARTRISVNMNRNKILKDFGFSKYCTDFLTIVYTYRAHISLFESIMIFISYIKMRFPLITPTNIKRLLRLHDRFKG